MKAALLIGGFGIALVMLAPAVRALLGRQNARMTDDEYFAAARRRAIVYRLAKTAASGRSSQPAGDE